MKKKIWFVVCISLLLCSCSKSNKVDISSYEKEIEQIKAAQENKDKFTHYQKVIKILNKIEEEKDLLSYKLDKDDHDEKSSYYENLYWEVKTKFIDTLQEVLQDDETKEYFVTKLNSSIVNDYLAIDTSKFFYAQKLESYNFENVEEKLIAFEQAYENKEDIFSIKNKFYFFNNEFYSLQKTYEKAFIFSCLDINDKEALDIANECEVKGNLYNNRAKTVIKNMLNDPLYKDDVAYSFSLNEEDISLILEGSIYSERALELMEEETNLVGTYSSLQTSSERKDLYVSLVELRQEIAEELGYDSYMDYVYKEVYRRDYSVQDSLDLCSNLLSSSKIKSLYKKLGYDNYFSSKYYDINYINSLVSTETDLWNALGYCEEVFDEASSLISYIKGNGLYNFETRNNKVGMSFVSSYSPLNTYYMMISRTSSAIDYSTVIHEFGHYYGMTHNDPNKATTSSSCLELDEIHSQGLQYLMTNYYNKFLSAKDAKQLTNMDLFNALWVIESSICVFELEYYAYTTPNLTKNMLENAFSQFTQLTTYPFSFGVDEYGNLDFTNVIHIYQQPGYYISYLTSLIPALEIYSLPLEEGKEVYNELVSYGDKNHFKETLINVGLSSPFEEETINKIANKLDSLF
ncbi:MAG: M12 family metallo-peptidase [Bacilli bacterium]